jgi:hypothetical protein
VKSQGRQGRIAGDWPGWRYGVRESAERVSKCDARHFSPAGIELCEGMSQVRAGGEEIPGRGGQPVAKLRRGRKLFTGLKLHHIKNCELALQDLLR